MRTPLSEEQRQKIRDSDVETLAKYVFRHLKDNLKPDPKSQLFYLLIDDLRKVLFSDRSDSQQYSDHAKLLEAIILLERRGLVARDFPYGWLGGNRDKFMVHLTSIGIESSIDDEVIVLVDKPEEIVQALERKVGTLDSIVRQYYVESLRAYQEGLHILSVLGLGVASERAIHWLAESLEAYSPKYQTKIKTRREGHIVRLTEYLSNTVIPDTFGHDKKFEAELKDRLDGLGKLYRENRNEAGHPKAVDQSWSREDQQILLLQFDRYITTICKAIGML